MARSWLPLLGVALVALFPSTSASAPLDPAARGLDAFIHVGSQAPAGSELALDLKTFGFAKVTEPAPLGGVTVELAWDPEHLGKGVSAAPPAVSVTSDATGLALAHVPMPVQGDQDDLVLVVHLRFGGHAREREIHVRRTWPTRIELHVADQRVVPGDDITAWATLTDTSTGGPVANTAVRVSLLEERYARTVLRATTDAAGAVMVHVPIPSLDDPTVSWALAAELDRPEKGPRSEIGLTLRDDTPGAPWLDARFDATDVDTGAPAAFTLRLRDGSEEPIAGAALRWWAGPSGTTPPANDDAWRAQSTAATTDGNGEVHATAPTPSVVRGGSTELEVVARATIEGHDLRTTSHVHVGAPTETVTLAPESHALVPGLEQRLLLSVRDAHDHGIAGELEVTGDGLSTIAKTDANGEAEISWRVPEGVGAARKVGPCAGGVAAAVMIRPKGKIAGLEKHPDPFSVCVNVDREATSLVRVEPTIAHVGDKVHVTAVSTRKSKDPVSVVLAPVRASDSSPKAGAQVLASQWIDPEAGGDLLLPEGSAGVWQIGVAAPHATGVATVASGALLVLPRSLPKLTATLAASSRLTPGGTAEIDAQLTDDGGKPLTGTVASVLVDLAGGGSVDGIRNLDTRHSLCDALGASGVRCDSALATTKDADAMRRAALGGRVDERLGPLQDPGGSAKADLDLEFASMLRSLEGAVYESSESPDSLRDVRRKTANGWELNPELLSLTTAAMSEQPLTPGGEPLSLGDLIAVDKQVTFDNVARRVTRLKLLHLLVDVRAMKHDRNLDDTDPVWADPNAILRRMVANGRITQDKLVDPWGGTLAFTKAQRTNHALLDVVPGWQLRSSGPNGVLGDGDDLTDPFARVLASGSPYARALGEDLIVDAKWDMEVSEPSVEAWKQLLEELTGTSLGGTGTGEGFGSGHGRLGGSHQSHSAQLRVGDVNSGRRPALWTAPVRTDSQGRVHLSIKLDAVETTWGVGLVALADHAPPATAIVELPIALPLSARVDATSRWIEGDEVAVKVTLRNRTKTPAHGKLTLEARGVAVLSDPREASRDVDVPASGVNVVTVSVKAPRPGDAQLVARLAANGVGDDTLTESWQVQPASELQRRVQSTWVTKEDALELTPLAGESLTGVPRLTLERGFGGALEDAMNALDPDALRGPVALSAALEVTSRVKRWAEAQPDRAPLVARADMLQRRAHARLSASIAKRPEPAARAALAFYAPASDATNKPEDECPPANDSSDLLEAEPAPQKGSSLPCWDAYATSAVASAKTSNDPARLAAAVLALSDRPHRASLLSSAAISLRDQVGLGADGSIQLSGTRRSERVLVYAALVRAASLGVPLVASEDRLVGWLSVDRDARGGYGSPVATRAVVRALLGSRLGVAQPSRAQIVIGDRKIDVAVPAQGRVVVPLEAGTTRVTVTTFGAPVLARFERPFARAFSHPPDAALSFMHLDVAWPQSITADRVATLHVTARSTTPVRALVRVPLPAGASLAEGTTSVRQIQGTLLIDADLGTSDSAWDVPLRFLLRGKMTAPEARATTSDADEPAIAPSTALLVR